MSSGKKIVSVVAGVIFGLFILAGVACVTPGSRSVINSFLFSVQKADDATRYETKKKVEDTCRAMISSYESDKLIYEQYKDSDNEEKQSWAEQAKMRANKTAATYNHFILENEFVWSGNVPANIKTELDYIE